MAARENFAGDHFLAAQAALFGVPRDGGAEGAVFFGDVILELREKSGFFVGAIGRVALQSLARLVGLARCVVIGIARRVAGANAEEKLLHVVAVTVGGKNDGGENAATIEEAIARGFFGVVQIAERAERVGAGVEQER